MKTKLLIEYDGTSYGGWQVQKNAKTVAGEILAAAKRIFPEAALELYGAGRTDAGVHALGQVAHLVCPESLAPAVLQSRLNDFLPTDIHILEMAPCDARFHARHHAKTRHYLYQVSRRRDAMNRKWVWWVREELDLERMKKAAALFVGFHNFISYSDEKVSTGATGPGAGEPPSHPPAQKAPSGANGSPDKIHENSTWVNLVSFNLVESGDQVHFEIAGSHFLRKMVRRLVGCLVEVGKGTLQAERLSAWLKTPSREPAAFTAPPHGLFLERVDYE